MDGELDDRGRWRIPLGLAFSFLANDGEELATLVATWPETWSRLPGHVPLPKWAAEIDQVHTNVGIAMMGALCTAAVVDGVRTRGRGQLYQDFQWMFGLHGFGHIAAAGVTRDYATGVVTSPTVVIPQLLIALRALESAGVPHELRPLRAAARVGGWLLVSHATGFAVSALVRNRR